MDGDPGGIRASAGQWSAFGREATDAAGHIRSLDTSLFIGPEGDQYRQGLKDSLPPHLDVTGQAYSKVASALDAFAGSLGGLQTRMRPLAARAPGLWQALQAAQGRVDSAKSADTRHSQTLTAQALTATPDNPPPPDTYQSDSPAASAALSNAQREWNDCLGQARKVKSDLTKAINTCVNTVNAAAGMNFKHNPHGWGALVSGFKNFVKDHVAGLAKLSGVLKLVSGIAGVLSFIPVIGEVAAPIALIAGGAALAIDASIKFATGQGSWTSIAVDGALMLLPGVGKLAKLARTTKFVRTTGSGTKVIVKSENLLIRTKVSIRAGGNRFSQILPKGTKVHMGPGGKASVIGKARAPLDVDRSAQASAYNGVRVSSDAAQNKLAARTLSRLERAGADDPRVDQAQVDNSLNKVGRNRPDVQATLNDQRVHFEYDRPTPDGGNGARVPGHVTNIIRNDPNSVLITVPSGAPTAR
ncbi:MAG TPA: hypothetical protein VFX70_16830 [Mycobacteriales bacterium]|nr:hypothetical protein [Mycobacteriales bacterium]